MNIMTNDIDPRRRTVLRSTLALGALAASGASLAGDFPAKPIRLIVPAPPGGGTDAMARLMASALAESAKWNVIAENRPGGGGNIGFDQAFRAPPDGYTLALGESSNMIVNEFLYHRIPYDIEKDMQPIALLAKVPLVLLTSLDGPHEGGPYDSVEKLVAAGRKGTISFASSGNGTLAHLVGELWKSQARLNMLHVPYRGAAPALTDLIGGQVDMFFASVPVALPMIQGGKVRALAVTAPERLSALKDVPTMAQAGYPGMDASVVFGLVGPAGIPAAVAAEPNGQVNKAMQSPAVARQLLVMGVDRAPGTFGGDPASFAALLREERAKWAPVVKASGAQVD
ncbi:Bug family tripartite tricarboxylate transporter substrate binding protein [Achromobacter aloeverae]|uniref:LacI family transcriptional regulator n=1 Tax=Achromobacter aloeverae TaxID=1750518 RepID=A0A4Q1HD62_9BURK|nr:tripartite tricarboxylate transporter substrate binding protein [Achromobacter aloeverae]RXN83765.1 LacI family transcriptional regulator [Achromobacter aloeverae]